MSADLSPDQLYARSSMRFGPSIALRCCHLQQLVQARACPGQRSIPHRQLPAGPCGPKAQLPAAPPLPTYRSIVAPKLTSRCGRRSGRSCCAPSFHLPPTSAPRAQNHEAAAGHRSVPIITSRLLCAAYCAVAQTRTKKMGPFSDAPCLAWAMPGYRGTGQKKKKKKKKQETDQLQKNVDRNNLHVTSKGMQRFDMVIVFKTKQLQQPRPHPRNHNHHIFFFFFPRTFFHWHVHSSCSPRSE